MNIFGTYILRASFGVLKELLDLLLILNKLRRTCNTNWSLFWKNNFRLNFLGLIKLFMMGTILLLISMFYFTNCSFLILFYLKSKHRLIIRSILCICRSKRTLTSLIQSFFSSNLLFFPYICRLLSIRIFSILVFGN